MSLTISVLLRTMRLRKIKLSGFKSFVDPITLTIPGNLVGIVGPNGCGKSNIIDAVMWVMGESSAKHLRGDALTDVIFNGSSARNPVGQASVELIFDNTENKLGGQYASYDEISIKRQINSDGISTYFLNGTRCRRRDITAIFLGTGLGPRSYAIIEQGTISRLIEAKPDELRSFIEEAAGISKYRERRRETENRIKHTKENILRLNDIREELDKQLSHLKRQARAAERYQGLKKEERQLEAELLALNWQVLKQQSGHEEVIVRTHENKVEAGLAELRHIETDIEKQRDDLNTANEAFNKKQSDFYSIGGEISQLEQKIQHTQERIVSFEQDLEQARIEMQQLKEHRLQDEEKRVALANQKKELEPELLGSRGMSDKAYMALNQAEQAMQSWQSEWDAFNETAAEYSRQGEIGQTRTEYLSSNIEDLNFRQQQLTEELSSLDIDAISKVIKKHEKLVAQAEAEQTQLNLEYDTKQKQLHSIRENSQHLNDELNEQRLLHQKLEGRHASLETLQHAARGQDQEHVVAWLNKTGLSDQPRLAQQMTVEPEWVNAVEIVLGKYLQDICVDGIDNFSTEINRLKIGQVGLISTTYEATKIKSRFPCLADKLKSTVPVHNLLAGIYIADNESTAFNMRGKLAGNESVITKDGLWLGVNWMRIVKGNDEHGTTLSREQEILKLKEELGKSDKNVKQCLKKAEQGRYELEQTERQLDKLQNVIQKQQETLSSHRAELVASQTQLRQTESRAEQIQEELDILQEHISEDRNELDNLRNNLDRVSDSRGELDKQREELVSLREKHRASLDEARSCWQQTHEESHGIALQLEAISSQSASLEQSLKRSQLQISHLEVRYQDLTNMLEETKSPLQGLQDVLVEKLDEKVTVEKVLSEARTRVQQIETGLREKEQQRTGQEHIIQELRDHLEKARLISQESHVRLKTIEEQLTASKQDLQEILTSLSKDAEHKTWQEKLESVTRKIHRLGPINLAAIDEFTQLSERKTYLDSQNEDLVKALTTLNNAIHKIDKESRTRFKETFDRLNTNLKETFPLLFGGGHASLELTGDDLLETGVTIMARPPGKRNSNIHLLSGGEKALTAVALIFSIFKLNPAPFCILDEVDAPLDDANVGRFSELVSNMSSDVQFVFITHNKITMEIAHQLLGVTMHEAGVSRLVSVDVDEAVEMAATA